MIKKYGNRLTTFGAGIMTYSLGFNLQVTGNYFPRVAIGGTNRVYLEIAFTAATSVTVDWGNGDIVTYPTKTSGSGYYFSIAQPGTDGYLTRDYPFYTYEDGLGIQRNIRFIFANANLVRTISLYGCTADVQPLRIKFNQYRNLGAVALTTLNLTDIDDSYLTINSVNNIAVRNAFIAGSRYYGQIPLFVLTGKNYNSITWSDLQFANKSWADSNLDKIATTQNLDTLKTLAINSSMITSANGGLPANFADLKIDYLDVQQNRYTTVPAVVNSITTLKQLNVALNPTLQSLGDLSSLTQLAILNISDCYALDIALPSWFNNLTALKTIIYQALGRLDANRQTAWIEEFYNFVVANAPMTGTSANPFRSMIINISNRGANSVAPIPAGVYQAPSGYIQGSNNGTPTSSLERIWVLVNQYEHAITYRAS